MFQHNFLITLRSLKKYKSNFLINLIGLSSGLACVLLIYLWIDSELGMDKFHANENHLYQVMEHQDYAEGVITTTSTPGILAETLEEEIPEIKFAATTTWITDFTLSVDLHNIKAQGYHVGPQYFEMFSYDLIQGDPSSVLSDKYNIVISEELALSLFKTTENVVGQQVVLQHDESYQISGVFKDTPENSSFQFDFVMSFEKYKADNDWVLEWDNNGPSTFVVLNEGSSPEAVNSKIANFIKEREEDSHVTLFLEPFSKRYLYGSWEEGKQAGGRVEYVRLFGIIALFILIIACINFMNLSTARASRRAKEVGVKKAVGAPKFSLINQFLTESVLISFFSFIIALGLVWVLLPQFNELTGKNLQFSLSTNLLVVAFGICFITGLAAGSYPALYLSNFKALSVLKGEIRRSAGELWVRRGLVIFQFWLSILLIISVIVVYQQVEYVQSKHLGYDKDNLIHFWTEGAIDEDKESFLTELRKVPGVKSASSIGHGLMGRNNNTSGLEWEGKNPEQRTLFENVRVNYDMLETMDVQFIEGRAFSREFGTDSSKIIFNEAAIEAMGLKDPIGKTIRLWNRYDLEILGIVKDFNFQSLHTDVKPLFFRLDPDNTWNIMAKIESGKEKTTIENITELHSQFNPGFAFEYDFMDDAYSRLYASEERVASLSKYFAGFAILISCLGLFGLASFTAERRIKEIGIRKVLGSSVGGIVVLLSKDFTILVGIAILLAIPVSYFGLSQWLAGFAYRIDLEWWLFGLSGVLSIIIAWFTVGFQAVKAAHVNPAACLKDE